jgi:hypothetical protein
MGNTRDYYRRTEANRLLDNLTNEQIEEMAKVAGIYFDKKEVARRADTTFLTKTSLRESLEAAAAKVLDEKTYFAGRGKTMKVSELRMEAAIYLVEQRLSGLYTPSRVSGNDQLRPMIGAPRPLKLLREIVNNTPDYTDNKGRCTFPGAPSGIKYKHSDSDEDKD